MDIKEHIRYLEQINKENDKTIHDLQKEIVHLKAFNKVLQSKVDDYVEQLIKLTEK